jgi:beta-lactam-binding protein with PASTA domain
MRICASCGRENPDDRDFCECGEYLRWDPTGVVQAVTPEMLQGAQEAAPPAAPEPAAAPPAPAQPPHPAARAASPPPAPERPGNGHGRPPAPAAPVPTTRQPAVPVPAPAPTAPAQPAEPDPAAITLRLPEGEQVHLGETLAIGAEPGGRARVLALVRNQSGIVDNYDLSVSGLPAEWYSVFPNTVYLVPFGTSGTYEQEVEIHLHPPRSAEAEARIWELEVVAESKAYNRRAATAPLHLGIQPFEEFKTKLEPERASGRRKAQFDVAVRNTANAPVTVALDAADADNELAYDFTPATLEIPPGRSVNSKMLVKPPRQKWIGRPEEKRIQVFTKTGDEAAQAKSAADMELPEGAEEGEDGAAAPRRKGLLGRLRATGPRAQVGTSGVRMTGPRVAKPTVPSKNVDLMKLRTPGGGSPAAAMPLMPNQVVFRQKPWLPWWLALVVPLLILLALFLFLFLPKNVVVPDVTGSKSTFDAEQKLTDAKLKLAPGTKQKISAEAPPGTVIKQTPAPGGKAEKDSEVAVLVAVGNGKVEVPSVVGKTQADAEKIFRKAKLTVGQVTPQPPDLKAKISSQIPAAKEVVQEGKPIDLFTEKVGAAKKKGGKDAKENGGGGAGGGGGGGKAAAVALPVVAGASVADAAKKAADAGLVPETVNQFSEKPKGALIGTIPPGGAKLPAGSKVKLLVSAGFPELAFDDGKDVLLANGANGKRLPAVAKGPQEETDPTFSFDGTKIAYVGDRNVFLADQAKPDEPPLPLTDPGAQFSDLAWAPTLDRDVIAMLRDKSPGKDHKDQDLCLLKVAKTPQSPQCISDPDINLEKTVRWAPDGKSIFAFGVKKLGTFGMVRYTSKKAFSARAKDWGKGKFVTDVSQPNKGVLDMAISPDGKRAVYVANFDSDAFQLYLGKPTDFGLAKAKPQGVRACKAAWRSDGFDLVVVQADAPCSEDNGQLLRMPVGRPSKQQQLGFSGDNPAFQPLTLG